MPPGHFCVDIERGDQHHTCRSGPAHAHGRTTYATTSWRTTSHTSTMLTPTAVGKEMDSHAPPSTVDTNSGQQLWRF